MNPIGIYEKALPKDISWLERLRIAKRLGFDFVEMSIDESDERLDRLDWTSQQKKEFLLAKLETGISVPSICLSGHRRFPLGSHDPNLRSHGLTIMQKAIDLAHDLGVRVIQLAGYDVYYEAKSQQTRQLFIENLIVSCQWAAEKQIILAIEIMDDTFINSISKYIKIANKVDSPWLYVYPDLGNLSAWGNDAAEELRIGKNEIAAIHLKDTVPVSYKNLGKFKDVPFGQGCVDFIGCFHTLKEIEYNGPFLIEMWSEKSNDYEGEIRKALDFLIPILKEAGFDYGNKFLQAI
ncbi:L-ribulose-5-phosphate 3-epimerase [Neobacillus niacini]|nr:L-ribulose-5-phosphate 3-epimerase [Neobacillus niacini]